MAIAAGDKHNIALRANGTIVAWGDNLYGQTTVPATTTNSVAIASGWFHNLAVTNGGVVAWGAGKTIGAIPHLGQSIVPSGLSNVVGISGGGYHSLALKRDGTVIGWGWNAYGQTNVPVGLSNVTAIAAGGSNSLALKADGTVIGWGNNTFGQTNVPGALSNVVAITANGNSCMALTSSGMLIAWGDNSHGQTNSPSGTTNIVAIASGRFHSTALMNDGSLSFISHPKSVSVTSGSTVQFEALAFGTPPIFYQWQFNGTNLFGATNTLLLLTNAGFADEGTYSVLVSNLNRTATSSNGTLNVFDLAEALASASLSWSTNGSSQWLAQTNITHDGTVAAACGPLVYGQGFSEVYTTVNGPGTLTFWWQGTSPYTTFRFYIDGILQTSLSFGGNWSQRTYHLTTGAHVLRWSAGNTWSGASTGTAYLDEVAFVPDREIRFESPQLSATNGGFVLNLTGLSGHGPVIIFASTNLADWRPVLTNPPHVGTLQLLEWSATNQPTQFYRAQEQ